MDEISKAAHDEEDNIDEEKENEEAYNIEILPEAENIKDEMIKYHLNLSNIKSIIKKQLQQFCVSSFLTIIDTPTYTATTNSNTNTTTTTNLNNLPNIYKAHLILEALPPTPHTSQTETPTLCFNIIKMLYKIHNTNALLMKTLTTSGHPAKDEFCKKNNKNQLRILKDFRLPFATIITTTTITTTTNTTNNNIYTTSLLLTLLLTPLLVTNEPLPKFLQMSFKIKQDSNTVSMTSMRPTAYLILQCVGIFLKFVIVIISIIDLLINFIIYLLFILDLFINATPSTKTLKTYSLSSLQQFKRNDSFKHFIEILFQKFTSNAFFTFNYRWKCFNFAISNFL